MLALPPAAVSAGPLVMLDLSKAEGRGMPPGWEVKAKTGAPDTRIIHEGGRKALCLRSKGTSFSVQRKIKVNLKEYPYLSWSWKAADLPEGGDFRDGGKDDQAAQLFVAFGRKSICYIWDTTAPVGSEAEQYIPMVMTVKIIVVESGGGKKGRWVTETRNVYEDYKRLYGKEPPAAEGLRYQINTQYTGHPAESCLESVEFKKAP
jgi:hypothetical protein